MRTSPVSSPVPCSIPRLRREGIQADRPQAFVAGRDRRRLHQGFGAKGRYQNAPMNLFLKFGRSIGISDFMLTQLYCFVLDYQRGSFAVGAPTGVVREIGGREPEDFETIARRYLARSSYSKRRMALIARAAWNMARAIASPVPDLKALALTLNIPSIPHASLAADSVSWRNSHAAAPVAWTAG